MTDRIPEDLIPDVFNHLMKGSKSTWSWIRDGSGKALLSLSQRFPANSDKRLKIENMLYGSIPKVPLMKAQPVIGNAQQVGLFAAIQASAVVAQGVDFQHEFGW